MTEHQFEIIFKENFAHLSNVAYSLVRDEDDSYDIVQQVFVKFWDKRDSVDLNDNIKSYLNKATINTALNFIDKHKRELHIDVAQAALKGPFEDKSIDFLSGEVEQAIKKGISELPEKCRAVFLLSRYSDKSNKEIADDLNISIKAVEKHITKALRELRIKLKPYLTLLIIFLMFEVGLLII